MAGLTDEEIASIAVALKPVLEKEEKSGDSGRSVKRGVLPETCSSETIKRGKAVLEPSSNPERVTPSRFDIDTCNSNGTIDGIINSSYNTDSGHDNQEHENLLLLHLQPSFGVLDGIREQQIGKKRCVC